MTQRIAALLRFLVPLAALASCSTIDPPAIPASLAGRERWIIERVARVRALPFPEGVTVTARSRDDLRREVASSEPSSQPADADERTSDHVASILEAFGLAKKEADAKSGFSELFGESALGIYSPSTRTLTMIDPTDAASGETTFAHEAVHAIDDGRYGIQRYLDLNDCDLDRWIAGRCVVEGCAKLNELDYALLKSGFDSSMALPRLGVWSMKLDVLRGDFSILAGSGPKRDQALAATAPAMVGMLVLPYVAGADFLLELKNRGGVDAVNRVFEDPPRSTTEILHPERYYRERSPAPAITIGAFDGALAGAQRSIEGALGEYLTRVWLGDGRGGVWPGEMADPGFRGDRFVIVDRGERRLVLWHSEWCDEDDAKSARNAVVDLLEDRENRHAEEKDGRHSVSTKEGFGHAVALHDRSVDVVLNAEPAEATSAIDLLSRCVAPDESTGSRGIARLLLSPFFRREEFADGTDRVDSLFGLLFTNESRPGGFDFRLGGGSLLHLTNTPDRAFVGTAFDLVNWRRNARNGTGSMSMVGLLDPSWSDDAGRFDVAFGLAGVSSSRSADSRRFDAHVLGSLVGRYAESSRYTWAEDGSSGEDGTEHEPVNEFDLAAAVVHFVGDAPEKEAPCATFRLGWGVLFGWRSNPEWTEWWTPLVGWDGRGDGDVTLLWGLVHLP